MSIKKWKKLLATEEKQAKRYTLIYARLQLIIKIIYIVFIELYRYIICVVGYTPIYYYIDIIPSHITIEEREIISNPVENELHKI